MVRFFSSSPCQTFLILYTFLFSLPLFLSGEAVFWWFKREKKRKLTSTSTNKKIKSKEVRRWLVQTI
nr:MAG TPA: hypothetical protein [Caudoviricetes sp.]